MDQQVPPPAYSLYDPSPHPQSISSPPADLSIPVSGAAYFEMRPAIRPRPANTLPCHIAVLPDTTAVDLPMPGPKRILLEREVEPHDWTTFVNHLIPYEFPRTCTIDRTQIIEKESSAGRIRVDEKFLSPPSSEADRQRSIKAVVEEWNQGFFLPRGLEIVVRVEVTPQPHQSVLIRSNPRQLSAGHTSSRITALPSSQTLNREQPSSAHRPIRNGKRNKDKELGIALYHAVKREDVRTCEALLQAGADPNARPTWETPAIVEATKKGNLPILQMLVDHGSDINGNALGDGTALYQAVSKGKTDMAKLLLNYGADPNKCPLGQDPLLCKAVKKQYSGILDLLLQYETNIDDAPPGGVTAMYTAAKQGETKVVKQLLATGAKPDARPMGYNTALFEAAKKGYFDICEVLLKNGAEVDATTLGGNTALWNIVDRKNESLVRLFLDHGANIHARTSGGESALERVVKKGHTDMVQLLLQYTSKVRS
ncbi:MAG: hypothetical protein L6R41_008388 [Letrouitia leprolyta]|nr:MAG: hypothetical protein L6R41_008388 [Letrouitia leprolyta]